MNIPYYTKGSHQKNTMLWSIYCKETPLCAVGIVVFIVMLLFNIKYLSCHVFFFYSFQGRAQNNFPFHIHSMKVDSIL